MSFIFPNTCNSLSFSLHDVYTIPRGLRSPNYRATCADMVPHRPSSKRELPHFAPYCNHNFPEKQLRVVVLLEELSSVQLHFESLSGDDADAYVQERLQYVNAVHQVSVKGSSRRMLELSLFFLARASMRGLGGSCCRRSSQ